MAATSSPKQTSTKEDIEKNKGLAILAYFGIFFLVPYLTAKESAYAQFHAKQGMNLMVLWLGSALLFWTIPVLGWLLGMAGYVMVLVLFIVGVMNAANGQMKQLPLIGQWELLK